MSGQHIAEGISPFLKKLIEDVPKGERIMHCLQCGSCGGSCPNSADMDHTPRKLFAMIMAAMEDEVLSSNTQWCCVSCYFCTTRCPQEIPITDLMYGLKRMALAKGKDGGTNAPALAKTFTDLLDRYGRSYELGIAGLYHLLNRPVAMAKMGPMGLSMFAKGRMSIMPTKIKKIDQLQAIINKARELSK